MLFSRLLGSCGRSTPRQISANQELSSGALLSGCDFLHGELGGEANLGGWSKTGSPGDFSMAFNLQASYVAL
jgi:hypothetical protein